MKTKTIKQVLKKKHEEWVKSITNEEIRSMAQKGTIITGGSIASMLLREQVNDFDLYFRDKETAVAIAKHYVELFKPKNKKGIEVPIFVDYSTERVQVVVKSAGVASENGTEKPYEYFEGSTEGTAEDYVSDVMDGEADINGAGNVEDQYIETEKAALNTPNEDKKPKFRPVFMSTNAITLSGKIQLVHQLLVQLG